MPDRLDRHGHRRSELELARLDFASARADVHSTRELLLLEFAVSVSDDDSARRLELDAHEAYCDALAIAEEHDLDR
jgi:hypothetical protein